MHIDRLSGLAIIVLGFALVLFFIPLQVEEAEGGSLSPRTFPELLSYCLIILGGIQILRPKENDSKTTRNVMGVFLLIIIIAVTIFLSGYVGFIYLSPVLSFILMRFMNEKRMLWYLAGCIGIPILVWVCVELLLERPIV